MMRFVVAVRRGDRIDDVSARVEFLRDALDGATLAGGVPSFEQDHHRPLLQVDLVAKLAKLDLPPRQFAHICRAVELACEIECFEHQAPSPASDSIASRNSASLAASLAVSSRGGAWRPRRISSAAVRVSKTLRRAYHFEVASTMVQ